jgi:hypothetical protein
MIKRIREHRASRPQHDEAGAALLLALVLLIVGSLVVGALATYVMTDFKTLPAIKVRTDRSEALKGGTRLAINLQRESGPSACVLASDKYTINLLEVTTTCTAGAAEMVGGGRYGIVSTSNKATSAHVTGGGTFVKKITSPIFLNSGRLSPGTDTVLPTADIALSTYTSPTSPVARYSTPTNNTPFACNNPAQTAALAASDLYLTSPSTGAIHSLTCQAQPWWAVVGQPNAAGALVYPALPPIPLYPRTVGTRLSEMPIRYGAPAKKCFVFYPGRYTTSITLDNANNYYFTSGVYYFEASITVTAGAKVVVGRGPAKDAGCTTDAVANGIPTSAGRPLVTDITGRGGTFIFGSAARLAVSGDSTSVKFNPRYATAANSASEGVSIRTVSTGVPTPNIEIPQDKVQLPNGSLVNVTAYSAVIPKTTAPITYKASSLLHDDYAVRVQAANSTLVSIPGFVITPHARFALEGGGTNQMLKFSGGLVATEFQFPVSGSMVTAGWEMGAVPNVGQRTFTFETTINDGTRVLKSRATLELDQTGQYAVSQWSVDV